MLDALGLLLLQLLGLHFVEEAGDIVVDFRFVLAGNAEVDLDVFALVLEALVFVVPIAPVVSIAEAVEAIFVIFEYVVVLDLADELVLCFYAVEAQI